MAAPAPEFLLAYLLTFSRNRTGIVEAVSRFLADNQANILRTGCLDLGHLYICAMGFRASVGDMIEIQQSYRGELQEFNPNFVLVKDECLMHDPDYTFYVTTRDREGVLAEVTSVIASSGGSIGDTRARTMPAADHSTPTFEIELPVTFGDKVSVSVLVEEIKSKLREKDSTAQVDLGETRIPWSKLFSTN